MFSREKALEEARLYDDLPFFNKTKNLLIIFVIGNGAFEFFSLPDDPDTLDTFITGVVVYAIMLIPIYFNQIWAMILLYLVCALSVLYIMADETGIKMITWIILLSIITALTYKSLAVAHYLKKQKSDAKGK